jgi:acyl-CoA-binding protein
MEISQMTEINSLFEQAAIAAKSLPERPDNDTLLQLYALFKQGSAGDVSGEKPGFFDFVAVAKYEAWEHLAGLSQDDARNQYIDLVRKLGSSVDD